MKRYGRGCSDLLLGSRAYRLSPSVDHLLMIAYG